MHSARPVNPSHERLELRPVPADQLYVIEPLALIVDEPRLCRPVDCLPNIGARIALLSASLDLRQPIASRPRVRMTASLLPVVEKLARVGAVVFYERVNSRD